MVLTIPHFKQQTPTSCLAACARMVLAYHGIQRTEAQIEELLGEFDSDLGRRFEDLGHLERSGFAYRTRWGRPEDLVAIEVTQLPVIASMRCRAFSWGSHASGLHAVVVAGADAKQVAVHDPFVGHGPDLLDMNDFLDNWYQKRYGLLIPVPR